MDCPNDIGISLKYKIQNQTYKPESIHSLRPHSILPTFTPFSKIITVTETQNIEYKQSWRGEYMKWICGFANAQGGKILSDLDEPTIHRFLKKAIANRRIPEEAAEYSIPALLQSLHLLTKDGQPTNAAVLLFGKDPSLASPTCQFRVGRFGAHVGEMSGKCRECRENPYGEILHESGNNM